MALTFTVTGMTCGGCTASVEKALKALDEKAGVTIDLASGRVDVESTAITRESAVQAVIDAGFDIG